ncbi:MAG TPA: GspH/FimT family pseudopilin [Vicinamibacterales bacterium]|nr:GspH/FimT family pseudopilin [Vicinamibacterales bacterium]
MAAPHCMHGYSLVELMFVTGLTVTVAAVSMPQLMTGLDEHRTAGAARYIATRFQRARMVAITRSAAVAIRFTATGTGYAFTEYVDGNGNGVIGREILRGVDRPLAAPERLSQHFSGVEFGTLPNLPAIDSGGTAPGNDPVRLGIANTASFSPLGSATAGTVYILGRGGAQYAVRLFGETGKTRLLKFDRRRRIWSAT